MLLRSGNGKPQILSRKSGMDFRNGIYCRKSGMDFRNGIYCRKSGLLKNAAFHKVSDFVIIQAQYFA